MSPDGEAIVTGAGDETLRFWNVFSKTRSTKVRGLAELLIIIMDSLDVFEMNYWCICLNRFI